MKTVCLTFSRDFYAPILVSIQYSLLPYSAGCILLFWAREKKGGKTKQQLAQSDKSSLELELESLHIQAIQRLTPEFLTSARNQFPRLDLVSVPDWTWPETLTHRDDLSTHANRLMASVAKEVAINGDGFPMVLIGPASIIPYNKKRVVVNCQMQKIPTW